MSEPCPDTHPCERLTSMAKAHTDMTRRLAEMTAERDEAAQSLRMEQHAVNQWRSKGFELEAALRKMTAERDALQAYIVDAPPVPAEVWEARATRAEDALARAESERDTAYKEASERYKAFLAAEDALRVAREALGEVTVCWSYNVKTIAKDALAKIDALTKPQEAADALNGGSQ
jgi:chromosome segregation ATPase